MPEMECGLQDTDFETDGRPCKRMRSDGQPTTSPFSILQPNKAERRRERQRLLVEEARELREQGDQQQENAQTAGNLRRRSQLCKSCNCEVPSTLTVCARCWFMTVQAVHHLAQGLNKPGGQLRQMRQSRSGAKPSTETGPLHSSGQG